MVQLIIPNAFQVAIEMTVSGQTIFNVIGIGGNFGTSNAEDVANLVKAGWEKEFSFLSQLTSDVKMVQYSVTDLATSDGAIFRLASNASGGLTASGISTLAASALIQLGSGTRNRSSRGRMYLGPLRETQINPDGRTLATATRTSIESAAEVFRLHITQADLTWSVLSRTQKSYSVITAFRVSDIIATQRRRLR